ncbi:Two-component response regulator SSK1p [Saitoella coloradoensis]
MASTRRVWVKRLNGTAATLVPVQAEDLVDDLKDTILRKYANALGRFYDSPDLTIRGAPRASPAEERMLRPDDSLIRILDEWYPGGQGLEEAFVIDVPAIPMRSNRSGTSPMYMPANLAAEASYEYFPMISENSRTGSHHTSSTASPTTGQLQTPLAHGISTPMQSHGMLTPSVHPMSSRPRLRSRLTSNNSTGSGIMLMPRSGRRLSGSGAGMHSSTPPHSNQNSPLTTTQEVPSPPEIPPPAQPNAVPNAVASIQAGAHPLPHRSSGLPVTVPVPPMVSPGSIIPPTLPTMGGVQPVSPSSNPTVPPSTASIARRRTVTSSADAPSRPGVAGRKSDLANNAAAPGGFGGLLEGVVPPINVLIVEDNIVNQKILEGFMRKRKIKCQVAMNGREAVDKWKQGGFHLVLMDIQLPIMSGIEATKEIRRLERLNSIGVFSTPTTPNDNMPSANDVLPEGSSFRSPVIIVALTASSLQSDRHEALAAGCNDFLTKPVSLVWLERKITEWGCMQALIDFEGWKRWKDKDRASPVPAKKDFASARPRSIKPVKAEPKANGKPTVAPAPAPPSTPKKAKADEPPPDVLITPPSAGAGAITTVEQREAVQKLTEEADNKIAENLKIPDAVADNSDSQTSTG